LEWGKKEKNGRIRKGKGSGGTKRGKPTEAIKRLPEELELKNTVHATSVPDFEKNGNPIGWGRNGEERGGRRDK